VTRVGTGTTGKPDVIPYRLESMQTVEVTTWVFVTFKPTLYPGCVYLRYLALALIEYYF
jgi:hypothetical protein